MRVTLNGTSIGTGLTQTTSQAVENSRAYQAAIKKGKVQEARRQTMVDELKLAQAKQLLGEDPEVLKAREEEEADRELFLSRVRNFLFG